MLGVSQLPRVEEAKMWEKALHFLNPLGLGNALTLWWMEGVGGKGGTVDVTDIQLDWPHLDLN